MQPPGAPHSRLAPLASCALSFPSVSFGGDRTTMEGKSGLRHCAMGCLSAYGLIIPGSGDPARRDVWREYTQAVGGAAPVPDSPDAACRL